MYRLGQKGINKCVCVLFVFVFCKHGDVITHFDGNAVEKGEQIIELLGSSVGKRHQVVVLRDHGEKKVLYVTSVETLS